MFYQWFGYVPTISCLGATRGLQVGWVVYALILLGLPCVSLLGDNDVVRVMCLIVIELAQAFANYTIGLTTQVLVVGASNSQVLATTVVT